MRESHAGINNKKANKLKARSLAETPASRLKISLRASRAAVFPPGLRAPRSEKEMKEKRDCKNLSCGQFVLDVIEMVSGQFVVYSQYSEPLKIVKRN